MAAQTSRARRQPPRSAIGTVATETSIEPAFIAET